MTRKTHPKEPYFEVLFGPKVAADLARAGWAALRRAARDPSDPLVSALPTCQRERLHALVALCERFYPEQDFEPSCIGESADAVRYYALRCQNLRQRVVWLLCLDELDRVEADVLVQVGGDPTAPPSVKTLLRHAIVKEAAAIYVADGRPEPLRHPDEATLAVFQALRTLGELARIQVRDYLVLCREGTALCLDEHLRRPRPPLDLAA